MSRYNEPTFKYYFNAKNLKILYGTPLDVYWVKACDKKLVEFKPNNNRGICEGYLIEKRWCDKVIDEQV